MGKKFLIGCGVFLLLGLLGTGTCSYMVYSKGKELLGDFIAHTQTASTMPLERMEQEALKVSPEDLVEKLTDYAGQPVRLTSVATTLDRASGAAPPPNMDTSNAVVVEPGILVTSLTALPAGARTPGTELAVLGIASFLNIPQRTGRPLVVVIARQVEVTRAAPGSAVPAAEQPAPPGGAASQGAAQPAAPGPKDEPKAPPASGTGTR
jgi:hypothetical protein